MHGFKILFFSICVLLLGCSDGGQSTSNQAENGPERQGPIVIADSTAEGFVEKWVSISWCRDYPGTGITFLLTAEDIFRYENCGEIRETMEVVETGSEDNITAAFIRYSVGTKIFRDVIWLRTVGGRYAQTYDRPSEYGDTNWSEAAIDLREEAGNWEDESAEWHN